MAQLATQPITPGGVSIAHAPAAGGGDQFTPGADVLLHLVNTSGSPVTATVATAAHVLDEHVADVVVTVPANSPALAGPFPANYFADPTDGLAHITYSDAAHTLVAAIGFSRGGFSRGTIVTQSDLVPTDLPSGSLWATTAGTLHLTSSAAVPVTGAAVTSGSAVPTDLAPGTVYVQLIAGQPVALFVAPGESALDLRVAAVAPTDLAANRAAVVLAADGTPSDLYVGGIA